MATSKEDNSDLLLSKYGESAPMAKDVLTCTICFDAYSHPRMLPCLHSFCEDCLSQHVTNASNRLSSRSLYFKCPQCRELIKLPDTGVAGFRRDFRVQQVRDMLGALFERFCSSGINRHDKRGHCDFCDSNGAVKTSSAWCGDCQKNLCQDCVDRHRRIELFANHAVREFIKSDLIVNDLCTKHKDEVACYICVTCETEVCSVCIITNSKHNDHDIRDLRERLNEYKANVLEAQLQLQGKLSEADAIKSNIESFTKTLAISRDETEEQIKQRLAEIKEAIQKSERNVSERLATKYSSALEHHQSLHAGVERLRKDMNHLEELTTATLEAPATTRLLDVYMDIPLRVETLSEELHGLGKQTQSVGCSLYFQPSTSKVRVGKVHINPPSSNSTEAGQCNMYNRSAFSPSRTQYESSTFDLQILYKFGQRGKLRGEFDSPRDVCFLSDDTIVLADCNNERLQRFKRNGILINTIEDGNIKPWGLAALPNSNIAVTDHLTKRVRIFTPDGKELASIGHFLCPCGIAVNNNGHLVVSDFFSPFVYTIDISGKPVNEFVYRSSLDKHACGVSRLAVLPRNNNILVADVSNRCLKMFSACGSLLWKSLERELGCPQGVSLSPDRTVLFVADAMAQNVLLVDPDEGRVVKKLVTEGLLEDLTGIDVSVAGYVVITQMKRNEVMVFKT